MANDCEKCNGEHIVETSEGDEVRYYCTKCRKEFETRPTTN